MDKQQTLFQSGKQRAMSELKPLEQKIDNMESTLEDIGGDLKSIKDVLIGNTINPDDRGVLGEVATLKGRVSKLEEFKNKAIWIGIGLAIGAGYGLDKFIEVFKH